MNYFKSDRYGVKASVFLTETRITKGKRAGKTGYFGSVNFGSKENKKVFGVALTSLSPWSGNDKNGKPIRGLFVEISKLEQRDNNFNGVL